MNRCQAQLAKCKKINILFMDTTVREKQQSVHLKSPIRFNLAYKNWELKPVRMTVNNKTWIHFQIPTAKCYNSIDHVCWLTVWVLAACAYVVISSLKCLMWVWAKCWFRPRGCIWSILDTWWWVQLIFWVENLHLQYFLGLEICNIFLIYCLDVQFQAHIFCGGL